jgi:CHAD domain-containing protein
MLRIQRDKEGEASLYTTAPWLDVDGWTLMVRSAKSAIRQEAEAAVAGSQPRRSAKRAAAQKPAVKADDIALAHDAETVAAFRCIASSILQQISGNEAAVGSANPQGVHQMRIGLRRMRAAISLFSELLDDAETARLKQELRWLTGRLGPARDLHLLSLRLRRSRASAPDRQRRLNVVETLRNEALATAIAALSTERYQKLLADLSLWIEAGAWAGGSASGKVQRRARDFADAVLAKRARKIVRRARDLQALDVEGRHQLRIAAKKLYYATGFFEALYDGRKTRDRIVNYQHRVKSLLDHLGALNDLAVQQQLTGSLAPVVRQSDGFAVIEPSRHERAKTERLLKAAGRAGQELADAKPFWD